MSPLPHNSDQQHRSARTWPGQAPDCPRCSDTGGPFQAVAADRCFHRPIANAHRSHPALVASAVVHAVGAGDSVGNDGCRSAWRLHVRAGWAKRRRDEAGHSGGLPRHSCTKKGRPASSRARVRVCACACARACLCAHTCACMCACALQQRRRGPTHPRHAHSGHRRVRPRPPHLLKTKLPVPEGVTKGCPERAHKGCGWFRRVSWLCEVGSKSLIGS